MSVSPMSSPTCAPVPSTPPKSAPRTKDYLRRVRWLWMDNDLVDRYGEAIGVNGLGMYAALARYANQTTGQCWPSLQRLSQQLDCTRRSARRYLYKLVEVGLITVEERPGLPWLITLVALKHGDKGRVKKATGVSPKVGKKAQHTQAQNDSTGGQKTPHELSDPNERKQQSEKASDVAIAFGMGKGSNQDLTIEEQLNALDAPAKAHLEDEAREALKAEGVPYYAAIGPVLRYRMEELLKERAASAAEGVAA